MQSKELTEFYRAYVKWVDKGAWPHHVPHLRCFYPSFGLCANLESYCNRHRLSNKVDIEHEMQDQFSAAGLERAYPFDSDIDDGRAKLRYNADASRWALHKNEKRMRWVREHAYRAHEQSFGLNLFYHKYLEWVNDGAKPHRHFTRYNGLCHNAGVWGDRRGYYGIQAEMNQQFVDAGLRELFPFNGRLFNRYGPEVEHGMAHLNEKRNQWVKDHAVPFEFLQQGEIHDN